MAKKEIKYGNHLIIDVIRKNIDSNNDNNTLNTIIKMYEKIPKLYEELEQDYKNNIKS